MLVFILFVALFAVSYYTPYLQPETARRFSLLAILITLVLCVVLTATRIRHLIRSPVKENIFLSPEVMGSLLGSIFTVLLGGFVVNHMMEAAEERGQVRSILHNHYETKSQLITEFGDKGQKILYYAISYRMVEEWLIHYDILEAQSTEPPKYGIGKLDREGALDFYNEAQGNFIEAGSLEGICRRIESIYFDGLSLNNGLLGINNSSHPNLINEDRNPLVGGGDQSGVVIDAFGQLSVLAFIQEFDEFLDPNTFSELDYEQTKRHLARRFEDLNERYNVLLKAMQDQLADDRQRRIHRDSST